MMSKNKYKVLHIFSSYGGGISTLILSLIENKSEDFIFDLMAFSYQNGDVFVDRIKNMGGQVFQMPRPRIDGYKAFIRSVEEIISKNSYDVIHCHITGWHAKPFMSIAKKYRINNFILHAHTTKYDSRIDRLLPVQIYDKYLNFKHSSKYMTCSDMAADYIYGKNYLKRRTAYLIPNGINEELFINKLSDKQKSEYFEEFSISEDSFVIGHVGRFSMQKNHMFILDIVKEFKKKGINFVLILVGSGELFDSIKEKAELYDISDNIRFVGRRLDIALLMQFFDCMILPSFYEGLPTVAIECQASGTNMILSDKITTQCDMNLDLLDFLPIDNAVVWAEKLEKVMHCEHLDIFDCLAQVRRRGFTANEAGKRYCFLLKNIIEQRGDD